MKRYFQTIIATAFLLQFSYGVEAQEFRLPRVAPGDVISADLMNEVFEAIEQTRQQITMADLVGEWRCRKLIAKSGRSSISSPTQNNEMTDYYLRTSDGIFLYVDLNLSITDNNGVYGWTSQDYVAFNMGTCGDRCETASGDIGVLNGFVGATFQPNPCNLVQEGRTSNNVCLQACRGLFKAERPSDSTVILSTVGGGCAGDLVLICQDQTLPPAAPSNLAASLTEQQATLSWSDNSGDETAFKILRKDRLEDDLEEIARTDAGVTTYSDTVTPGTYWYRVLASNANGDSFGSNLIRITVEAPPPPPPPDPTPAPATLKKKS